MATGIPVTFLSVGEQNNDGFNGFLDEINDLLSDSSVPTVLSTSYGFDEDAVSASVAKYVSYRMQLDYASVLNY